VSKKGIEVIRKVNQISDKFKFIIKFSPVMQSMGYSKINYSHTSKRFEYINFYSADAAAADDNDK